MTGAGDDGDDRHPGHDAGPDDGPPSGPVDEGSGHRVDLSSVVGADAGRGDHTDQATGTDPGADAPTGATGGPLGVPVPDEFVGAFVAEVFEDPERATAWEDVVDALVADDAAAAWAAMTPDEQVVAVLERAHGFDRRAAELLASIPDDGGGSTVEPDYREAIRLRRNADVLRDGVADAYGRDLLDDDGLVDAVETVGFDTDVIARRERELERVATAHGFDFRPYGGTLLDPEDGPRNDACSVEW